MEPIQMHRFMVVIEQKAENSEIYFGEMDFFFDTIEEAKTFAWLFVSSIQDERLFRARIELECESVYNTPENTGNDG